MADADMADAASSSSSTSTSQTAAAAVVVESRWSRSSLWCCVLLLFTSGVCWCVLLSLLLLSLVESSPFEVILSELANVSQAFTSGGVSTDHAGMMKLRTLVERVTQLKISDECMLLLLLLLCVFVCISLCVFFVCVYLCVEERVLVFMYLCVVYFSTSSYTDHDDC
jgi:hypothetical protein